MAIYLNNNVGVKLATAAAPTTPSIDISDVVSSAVINQIIDELEVTAMEIHPISLLLDYNLVPSQSTL